MISRQTSAAWTYDTRKVREDLRERESLVRVMIVVQGKAQLFHVVAALRTAGGFPRLLDGGQQERDQDRDDRNDHKQFNKSEGISPTKQLNTYELPFKENEENNREIEKIGKQLPGDLLRKIEWNFTKDR